MEPKVNNTPVATGLKYDTEKIPLELLDPVALEGLGKVLEFGKKKYAAHNWRGGISFSRLLGAALRHTFAIIRGEDNDPESGLPHVDHLGCCWMFLSNMMKTRPDLDDRWKSDKPKQPEKMDPLTEFITQYHPTPGYISPSMYDKYD
jgi:hypothetical protein